MSAATDRACARRRAFRIVRDSGPVTTKDVAIDMQTPNVDATYELLRELRERGLVDYRNEAWYLAGERRCPRCNDWIPLEVTNMSARAVCDLCRGFESEEPEPLGYDD